MKCKKCGVENAPNSKYCQECGSTLKIQKNNNNKTIPNRTVLLIILTIIALFVVYGLIQGIQSLDKGFESTNLSTSSNQGLELINSTLNVGSVPVIIGYVKNNGATSVHNVEIRAKVYNKQGIQVAEGVASTLDLGAGTTWRFEIYPTPFLESNEINNYTIQLYSG